MAKRQLITVVDFTTPRSPSPAFGPRAQAEQGDSSPGCSLSVFRVLRQERHRAHSSYSLKGRPSLDRRSCRDRLCGKEGSRKNAVHLVSRNGFHGQGCVHSASISTCSIPLCPGLEKCSKLKMSVGKCMEKLESSPMKRTHCCQSLVAHVFN